MSEDAGSAMKQRMRQDLREAMKGGRSQEASLIRALIASLDNAEAPPRRDGPMTDEQHRFQEGSAEIERSVLDPQEVNAVLIAEIEEREQAAAELQRLGAADRAEVLHAEVRLARRYVED